MSWVEWMGEILEPSADEGELYLHIGTPDVGHERQHWHFELMHVVQDKTQPERNMDNERVLTVDISDLLFQVDDWRQLAHREIRADAAWHEAHEYSGEHGWFIESQVRVGVMHQEGEEPRPSGGWHHWLAHDFILRIGARDGHHFSCELDAWMIPEKEYTREKPESPEEVAVFAAGPPNLRMICRLRFDGGSIRLPRVPDPLAEARRRLRKQLRLEEFFEAKVNWNPRWTPDHAGLVQLPGGRSSVSFRTRPYDPPASLAESGG